MSGPGRQLPAVSLWVLEWESSPPPRLALALPWPLAWHQWRLLLELPWRLHLGLSWPLAWHQWRLLLELPWRLEWRHSPRRSNSL